MLKSFSNFPFSGGVKPSLDFKNFISNLLIGSYLPIGIYSLFFYSGNLTAE
jgi:hypothetical protein